MSLPPFLTYALAALALAVFVAGFFVDRLPKRGVYLRLRTFSVVIQIAALVGVYFVLRPGRGDSRAKIDQSLAQSQPVMIDLYSNY